MLTMKNTVEYVSRMGSAMNGKERQKTHSDQCQSGEYAPRST